MKESLYRFCILLMVLMISIPTWSQTEKSRLIVLADMGNEPDEMQQMMQLLMYSDVIDIEGLISVTSIHLKPGNDHPYRSITHPELFHQLIDGYEKVFHNLHRHTEGWMKPFDLRVIVSSGQQEYGMAGVGEGKSTDGSDWIIRQVTNEDPRPLYIAVNGGSNTLAQAIFDYRITHTTEEVDEFVKKLRVYENGAQDDAGAWINHEFPDINWIRSLHQTKDFGGPFAKRPGPHTWKPFDYSSKGQDDWAHEHIRTGHGALGELYPIRIFFHAGYDSPDFLGGGGIIPWMRLASPGLTDPSEPSWGGWSGRYTVDKKANMPARDHRVQATEKQYQPWAVHTEDIDHWVDPSSGREYNDIHTAVWRWRQAMYNDLQARMDWCVKAYDEANHHPVAVLNGDESNAIIKKTVSTGEKLSFDASGSRDPDQDNLHYCWWIYPEAGRNPYGKELEITNSDQAEIELTIPIDSGGKELHLILEVWDESNIVPLVDYRRVFITVK